MGRPAESLLTELHRQHYGALVAPLIRILGSFELAEEVVQDAFAQALQHWQREGLPDEPLAWLRRVAKNGAIDSYRREQRWQDKVEALALEGERAFELALDSETLADDALRLIFTCCHPSLAPAAQVALTLRTVCGLRSEEVARALLVSPSTLQQRIVRAKRKIDAARIPYSIPQRAQLGERLDTVLKTVYLVFNEGYGAADGDALIRKDLCEEAIRLAGLLLDAMPEEAAPKGLLALMLLHHSRRRARINEAGDLVPLEEQDRATWDHELIARALPLVEESLRAGPISSYAVEAAIAALHARATQASETDWPQIAGLYRELERRSGGNPVIALNAAVALALAGRPDEGLRRLDALEAGGDLARYHLLPAARGDLLRRMGRHAESRQAYEQALQLVTNAVEKRFIEGRLSREIAALDEV